MKNLTLKGSGERWYPELINELEAHFRSYITEIADFDRSKTYPLIKNLAYTLQYIQFLYRVISDLELTDVLYKQNVKSFIIHGAAVVEAIFQYLVIKKGYGANTEWESVKKFKSNEYQIKEDSFMNETEVFIKLNSPILQEMTFDQLAKKVESKKLLGDVSSLYAEISKVRKLRNKVHIQEIQNMYDTDYNTFNTSTFNLMRRVLYGVLTSEIFDNSSFKHLFTYLDSSS